MLSTIFENNFKSNATYVTFGYGQVEPNHLSAQKTGQIFAQLPAAADIDMLEQGQFAKYNYAAGVVDFDGPGEWMLVYNEIKLYREGQLDCEFAMIKDNYQARYYSPFGGNGDDTNWDKQSRYYNGVDANGNVGLNERLEGVTEAADAKYLFDDVTAGPDPYEFHYNEDPYHIESQYKPKRMPAGTQMVPRLFKTNLGDHFTTNTIKADPGSLAVGDMLKVGDDGYLTPGEDDKMTWQVVKVYTMPDHQPGVKIMRVV